MVITPAEEEFAAAAEEEEFAAAAEELVEVVGNIREHEGTNKFIYFLLF